MSCLKKTFCVITAAVAATWISAGAVAAQDLTLKLGFSSGGSGDMTGRLVARHLPNHLEGTPNIIVQNVPGGGGLKLIKLMLASEPADGSVLGVALSTPFTQSFLTGELAASGPESVRWVGASRKNIAPCWAKRGGVIETPQDFLTKPIRVASEAKSGSNYMIPAFLKNVFDAPLSIITGFAGATEMAAALERGEVDAVCGVSGLTVGGDDFSDIYIFAMFDDTYVSVPEGVAVFSHLVTDPQDKEAIRLLASMVAAFNHPLFLPPGTPDEVVDRYRTAFEAMLADPAFITEAERMGFEIMLTTGAEIEAISVGIADADPELSAHLVQLME